MRLDQPDSNSPQRLRVAVFIEHDIVYRHFVQSGALSELAARHDMTVVVPARGSINKRLTIDISTLSPDLKIEEIALDIARVTIWRRLFQISQLRWRRGSEWHAQRAIMRYLIGPKAAFLYSLLALPGVFALYQAASLRKLSRMPAAMATLLDRLRPNVIVHPTVLDGYFINDFVTFGRSCAIPTIALMNSWDNPSTKRAVIGNPDWLLVWGPQTRDHAVRFMDIAPERALPFGAAQFEIYRKPPRVTRDAFCVAHGIDPARQVLLYAGSSKGSDEFVHLCMIDDAIESGELGRITVVYRPHPWGRGGFKGERLLDHPWRHVRIERSMRGYLEQIRAGRKTIHLADYADTHDVLAAIDALVSPLSTIILEGALHGKPVLCFLPDDKPDSSLRLQSRHVHFDDMYASKAILKADGDMALIGKLRELMARVGDQDFQRELVSACAYFVAPFAEPYATRLAQLIEQVAAPDGNLKDSPHARVYTRVTT